MAADAPAAAVVSPSAISDLKVGGIFGILTGILCIVFVVAALLIPNLPAVQVLPDYHAHPAPYVVFSIAGGLVAIVGIPFVATLGQLLKPRGAALASAGTLLSTVGLAIASVGVVGFVSVLDFANTTSGIPPVTANWVAGVVGGATSGIAFGGTATISIGLVLFGISAWKSRTLPNWLGIVGIVGGLVGFGVTGAFSGLGPIITILTLAAWAFASAVLFLAPGRMTRAPSGPPAGAG